MAPTTQKTQIKIHSESKSVSQLIKKEVLCDGYYYDVTDFAKRHPGGSRIDYYTKTGEDATLAFIVKFFGCALLGLGQARSGWVHHEGGHHSLTGVPKLDRTLEAIICGIGVGLSATWWRRGHNRHHAMPQRINHDVDLATLPLLAYNVQVAKDPKQGKTFLVQNQKYLFLLVDTLLGTLLWQLYLHPRYILKHGLYLEALSIATHYYFFAYQIGFWSWLISTWLGSIYLFGNFALSHTHLPVTTEPTHWVEYGLLHTADVEQRPWCDWFELSNRTPFVPNHAPVSPA